MQHRWQNRAGERGMGGWRELSIVDVHLGGKLGLAGSSLHPYDGVQHSEGGAQPLRNLHQQLISSSMAEAVIHHLELIQINVDDREGVVFVSLGAG